MTRTATRELELLTLEEPHVSVAFTYRRFSPDELQAEPASLDARDPLRYVELAITVPNIPISAASRPSDIVNEHDFLGGDFSLLTVDGAGTPEHFVSAVSSSLLLMSTVGVVAGESRHTLGASFDAATPDAVSTQSICDAFNTIIPSTATPRSREFESAIAATARARVNTRILNDLVRKMASGSFSPVASSAQLLLRNTLSTQRGAINGGWIQQPPSLSTGAFTPTTTARPSITWRGLLIERTQVNVPGKRFATTTSYVQSADRVVYRDPAVKYGATYRYVVSTVCDVTIPAISDAGVLGVVTVACRSSGTIANITCVENVPPPPPSDLNVTHVNGALLLTWCMPVNVQRDIARFQVFKRASLQVPFTLLAELDFSVYDADTGERPELSYVVNEPTMQYADGSFTPGDIYAVVSIDAHGLTSGYSQQLHVTLRNDRAFVRRAVPAGCPKAYPNLYYESDPFPDITFEQGKASIDIAFTPQHLSIRSARGTPEPIVVMDTRGYYALQVISLDALVARTVKITIADARS